MTDEQFKMLLATLKPSSEPQHQTNLKDPSALGTMRTFTMGTNKHSRLKLFDDWLEEAKNRMEYIGVSSDKDKTTLLKTWGGRDLVEFMKQSAKINFEIDSYDQIITKIREEMKRLVNRSLAMHNLLNTKQGSKPWMQFLKELEDKAYLLDFDNHPYKQSDAIKDAAIFGMTDNRLKEKALSEDPDLTTLTKWGQAREKLVKSAYLI